MKKGWEMKKLGDVCDFYNGQAHEKCIDEKGKFILINSKFISSDGLSYKRTDKCLFPLFKNDVVMVMSDVPNGKALAKCFLVDKNNVYTLNQRICAIRTKTFDPKFLTYQLNRNKFLLGFNNGENQTNLRKNDILNCPVLIPPISEQREIVSFLDKALNAIEQAKINTQKNIQSSKELFKSYLYNVFSYSHDNWEEKKIGELCDLMTGGTPKTSVSEYYNEGTIKWLVSGDVNMNEINDCAGRISELGMANSNARYLPVNSVIIALNGQGKTRGTVAMLRIKATCNQSLVSIYPKNINTIIPELIFYNLKMRYEEIRKITGDSGNDRRGLNMPLIKNLNIRFPKKIEDQKYLVSLFSDLDLKTKKLERLSQQKIIILEELKMSLLQITFEGQLTTTIEKQLYE